MKLGRKFLHSVFEVSHLEFQTYDLSGRRVLFSTGVLAKLLGYTQEEYEALSEGFYKTIVHPDDVQMVKEMLQRVVDSKPGEVVEMTARLRRADGNYAWLYSRQMMYERRDNHNICTIIREVEDVTKLLALQNELEERVAQLKLVSYKNSHLVRAPVATILGLVNMVEDHGINSEHNRQIIAYLKETIAKLDEVIYEINNDARLK
jgi:PAS domain S-box-containing protein